MAIMKALMKKNRVVPSTEIQHLLFFFKFVNKIFMAHFTTIFQIPIKLIRKDLILLALLLFQPLSFLDLVDNHLL